MRLLILALSIFFCLSFISCKDNSSVNTENSAPTEEPATMETEVKEAENIPVTEGDKEKPDANATAEGSNQEEASSTTPTTTHKPNTTSGTDKAAPVKTNS